MLDSMQSSDVKTTYANVSKYLLRKEVEIARNVLQKMSSLGCGTAKATTKPQGSGGSSGVTASKAKPAWSRKRNAEKADSRDGEGAGKGEGGGKSASAKKQKTQYSINAVQKDRIRKNAEAGKGCAACGLNNHKLRQCNRTNPEIKKDVWDVFSKALKAKEATSAAMIEVRRGQEETLELRTAMFGGGETHATAMLDTGSTHTMVSRALASTVSKTRKAKNLTRIRLGAAGAATYTDTVADLKLQLVDEGGPMQVEVKDALVVDQLVYPPIIGNAELRRWYNFKPAEDKKGQSSTARRGDAVAAAAAAVAIDELSNLVACDDDPNDLPRAKDGLAVRADGGRERGAVIGEEFNPPVREETPGSDEHLKREVRVRIAEPVRKLWQEGKATKEQYEEALRLATRHWDEFRTTLRPGDFLNEDEVEPYKVSLRRSAPDSIIARPRKVGPARMREWREVVDHQVRTGVLVPRGDGGTSRYISNSFLLNKPGKSVEKDGAVAAVRLIVSHVEVNAHTVQEQFPMPDIEVVHSVLSQGRYFVSCDCLSAFHQRRLHPDTQELYTLRTPFGLMKPTRLPMGSVNSAAAFQAVAPVLCGDSYLTRSVVWVDDVVGAGPDVAETLKVLRTILENAKRINLKFGLKKSHFFVEAVVWCGRRYQDGGYAHVQERAAAMAEWPIPKRADQLQSWVGAVIWFKDAVPGLMRLCAPLLSITAQARKKTKSSYGRKVEMKKIDLTEVGFTKEHESLMKEIVGKLVRATRDVLVQASEDEHYVMFTDASLEGLAAILVVTKDSDEGVPFAERQYRPARAWSRVTSDTEKRYDIVLREARAIVEGLLEFADIVKANPKPLDIVTDSGTVHTIFHQDRSSCARYVALQYERMAVTLRGFRYRLFPIPGVLNKWADFWSRPSEWMHLREAEEQSVTQVAVASSMQAEPSSPRLDNLPTVDEVYKAQLEVEERARPTEARLSSVYKLYTRIDNGRHLIWAPPSLQRAILATGHAGDGVHQGIDATLRVVADTFWWPHMRASVKKFVDGCAWCLKVRGGATIPRPLGETLSGRQRGEVVSIDFCTIGESARGYKHVLAITDDFSGMSWLKPTTNADSEAVVDTLMEWVADKEAPRFLVSDGGPHFTAAGVQHFLDAYNIKRHTTVAYRSQANGVVERLLRTMRDGLSAVILQAGLDVRDRPDVLPSVNRGLNLLPRERLDNKCPLEVWSGRKPTTTLSASTPPPSEALVKLMDKPVSPEYVVTTAKLVQQSMQELDRHVLNCKRRSRGTGPSKAKHLNVELGSYVLWSNPVRRGSKLAARWTGPWLLTARHSEHVFSIVDLDGSNVKVVHSTRLRPFSTAYIDREEDLRAIARRDEQSYFDVANIVKHRHVRDTVLFTITFQDNPDEQTVVPGEDLFAAAPRLVRSYATAQRPRVVALDEWLAKQESKAGPRQAANRQRDQDQARRHVSQRAALRGAQRSRLGRSGQLDQNAHNGVGADDEVRASANAQAPASASEPGVADSSDDTSQAMQDAIAVLPRSGTSVARTSSRPRRESAMLMQARHRFNIADGGVTVTT